MENFGDFGNEQVGKILQVIASQKRKQDWYFLLIGSIVVVVVVVLKLNQDPEQCRERPMRILNYKNVKLFGDSRKEAVILL